MRVHPPKPRLAFRVGVVGHRPDRLKGVNRGPLQHQLHKLLSVIQEEVVDFAEKSKDLFVEDAPVLRAISPLAEGVDRLFARAALDLGYQLCAPMPFKQEEFERDFVAPTAIDAHALAEFHEMIASARQKNAFTKYELDGGSHDGMAYGNNGRVVMNQSDILVVVWDGERKGKTGGTEATFDEASRKGVPVIWVDSFSPHRWRLLNPHGRASNTEATVAGAVGTTSSVEELKAVVHHSLARPAEDSLEAAKGQRRLDLEAFYRETKHRLNPSAFWRLLRDAMEGKIKPLPNLFLEDFEKVGTSAPGEPVSKVEQALESIRPFYTWSDKLALYYSDLYRSAFVMTYLLAAFAVALTLLPLAADWVTGGHERSETVCVSVELGVIVLMLVIVLAGHEWAWHQRWLAYRMVAELLSHLRIVLPLGGSRPFPKEQAHLAVYGHPSSTWMNWYVRAVERDIGLPDLCMDQAQVRDCLAFLINLLKGQIDYHEKNSDRFERIEQRLHRGGALLLGGTLLACAAHLLLGFWPEIHGNVGWLLTFFCGVFPALGASFAGITNQGEFSRITKRSRAMKVALFSLLEEAQVIAQKTQVTSSEVGDLSERAADLMVKETLDWRIVFMDQPLRPA